MNKSERQAMAVLIVFLLLLLAFGVLVFIFGENQHAMQHGLTNPVQTKHSEPFLIKG